MVLAYVDTLFYLYITLRFVLRNWDFQEIVQPLAILLVYKHELKTREFAHRLVTVTHG